NLGSRFRTAGLKRRPVWPHADHLRAPIREDRINRPPKSGAVRKQEHNRSNSPRHSEHGKGCAASIVRHRAIGLAEKIANHAIPSAGLPQAATLLLCAPDTNRLLVRRSPDIQSPELPTMVPIWECRIPEAPAAFPMRPSGLRLLPFQSRR